MTKHRHKNVYIHEHKIGTSTAVFFCHDCDSMFEDAWDGKMWRKYNVLMTYKENKPHVLISNLVSNCCGGPVTGSEGIALYDPIFRCQVCGEHCSVEVSRE